MLHEREIVKSNGNGADFTSFSFNVVMANLVFYRFIIWKYIYIYTYLYIYI